MGTNGSPYDDATAPKHPASSGAGASEIGVLHDNEKRLVVLRFPEPKLWVGFDPVGARNVADAMHAEADLLQRLVTREDRMKYAAQRMRDTLITRVTIMLTSMEADRKKPAYQAAHIVDQVLQAVSELASR